jgi:hypothetical protein
MPESTIAVAAIDFHETRIFRVAPNPDGTPDHVVPQDPHGFYRHMHHKAGSVTGAYLPDSDEYWRELAKHLHDADAIILLGHGTGKSNASHHFAAYLEKHESDVAAKIVAEYRCDIDDLTDPQVLRIAQNIIGLAPRRDAADRRDR